MVASPTQLNDSMAMSELEGLDNIFSDDEMMDEVDDEFAKVNIDATSGLFHSDALIGADPNNVVFFYRMFYNSLFPYKPYFQWLNFDTTPNRNFTHREFSFTLPSDIYIRFKSFANIDELKKEIERIQPIKIDIGAIYAVKPNLKKTVSEKAFKPIEKELVLDIDMTDYDDIRSCCSGGDICHLCWEFMTVAIKVIDAALRDDFGFKHVLWVYSGRRGVHCWVSDERARRLTNDRRKAIVNYLNVVKGSAQKARRVKLNVLHPSLKRSLDILNEHFDHLLLNNMGILDTEEGRQKILEIIPDRSAKEKIEKMWQENTHGSAQEKWDYLNKTIEKIESKKRYKDHVGRDIVFQYAYPRLDVKVSTNINHLLKSPFCVHPKTLKVCVPIRVEDCENFDPLNVPTLPSLSAEIHAYNNNDQADKSIADYKKTSLAPYIDYFDKYAKSIILQTKKDKRVYGRKRIYTSLPTMAKTKSPTASKTRAASPVTSSRLSWEWINPSEDNNYYAAKQKNSGAVSAVKQNLTEMFLPVGYPESVHSCYKKFHSWLFLETYVGSAVGVLCSQAMLASLGLGTVEATGGAVAIQWVLKDGIGEIVGSFLQLCTSIVSPKFFLPLAAAGNMFELIHESIWLASHMTFTKHFSPNGNIGDIVAKDDAQMSTAHLLGMLSGVGIISISHSPLFLFGAFAVLSPINIWSTVKMLHAAEFEILNQAKLTLLAREYIDQGQVATYEKLRDREIGFGEWIKPSYRKKRGAISIKIKMGPSAEQAYGSSHEVQDVVHTLKQENYLLNHHKNTMWILFHQDAGSKDVLKSVLHSLKFHDILSKESINKETDWDNYMNALRTSLDWTRENYDLFAAELDEKNWQIDTVYWNDSGMRLAWDRGDKQ
ncbi:hypothetical protein G6F21_000329 [Rhizopus arrhizus]|nr:hypothetical protein G6F21_000329 [Rhizopus arrhizus]KAG0971036.1 hypothetical protein G6F31_000322 [Rhizopus arrhizus]KAG1298067.1 hypothetical protein G6F66_002050 [Rhizopus arrhizus]